MKWLSAKETEARIRQLPSRDQLLRIYALSLFVEDALYGPGFRPSAEWCEAVVLTSQGEGLLSDLHQAGVRFPPPVEHFTVFCLFYHRDLLVDHEKSDSSRILGLLRAVHRLAEARWPYVFGNLLYHKFNDSYHGNRTDSLDAGSAERLLSDTPQGVFQVGNILSGPLGFVESEEKRIIPPTLRLPLWHCSDPGCRAPHLVRLEQHKNDCAKARSALARYVADSLGPRSEWHGGILHAYRRGRWPEGRRYSDLPAVLGDCIVGAEREGVCVRALRSPHNATLSQTVRDAKGIKGTPEDLASALTPEEQQQLLLILPDKDIVHLIDQAVCENAVRIPPPELRAPNTYAYGHPRDTGSQLSSLGIRSTGHPPIIELAALTCNTYEQLGIAQDLAWRVRGHAGPTLRHSVMDFIRAHGPSAAVRELVLPARDVTAAVGESLVFRVCAEEDEDKTCSRLLWKFGFNTARYEDEYVILRNRIAEFRDRVVQMPPRPDEGERAAVRAVAVNLFVSVEEFLENMLCYNVWLLTSDHFTGTRFRFTKQDGLRAVSRVLGAHIESGDELVRWSEDGTNTLGVLLGYLHAFRHWLRARRDADRTTLQRESRDFPHYAQDTLWVFPFRHTQLWADVPAEVMAAYLELLDKICTQIAQAELPAVRNALDHKRQDSSFPDGDKMLACVTRLLEVVDTADSNRLIPKLFWGVKTEGDADGNVCHNFADYRGVTVALWTPSPVCGAPSRKFGVPYLIAPFDLLNQPNSTLVFVPSPRTEYSEYWKNYPRARPIPAEEGPSEGCDPADSRSPQMDSSDRAQPPERASSSG